ncbi:MAG: class I SAM-dependent methyltransferase [Bryobacteraceae bacterium]|nr:class I SAM-dependent methyltransferase [Bryobacteraceae bacterium]
MKCTIALLVLGLLPASAQKPFSRDLREHAQSVAPFVLSPQPIVDRMLELANLRPGEVIYDLGCGDGRILITAAQRYKARGVGIELSEKLVQMANTLVQRLGLQDQIEIRQGHLLNVKLGEADVVTLYLETTTNEMLRPNMEKELHPGARVVSHDFEVRGWKPVKVEKINAFNRHHTIFLYEMTAPALPGKPARKAHPKSAEYR